MAKPFKIPLPDPLFDSMDVLSREVDEQLLPPQVLSKPNKFHDDYRITRQFLLEYKRNLDTFNSYRRELERLLEWCVLIRHASFAELKRDDILSFIDFCASPPSHWIGINNSVARFVENNGARLPNEQWRPFVVRVPKSTANKPAKVSNFQLSNNAMKAIFRVLSSFFHYLVEEDYVSFNPLVKIRQKAHFIQKKTETRLNRTLSTLQWLYVIDAAEVLAEEDPLRHERTLFIMSALFSMYLRVSELVDKPTWTPLMNHFYKDANNTWWFKVLGKGNKERDIVVSDDMLKSLKRYRQYLGLSPLPSPSDNSPLLPKARGNGGIASTRQVRRIVQTCFDFAVERLIEDGLREDGELLKAATVHWMRHTGISYDVQHRKREHVRDDAGHTSGAITDLYIDVDKKDRHRSGRRKKIIP